MQIDIRSIRYFCIVAAEKSFSRAAERLHISQPSLSLSIKRLEEYLETDLFFRNPKGVELTSPGEIFLAKSNEIINSLSFMVDEIRSHGNTPNGKISIGLPSIIIEEIVTPLIIRAKELWPKLTIQIMTVDSGDIPELLLSKRIDIAISYSNFMDNTFQSSIAMEDFLVAVGPLGYFGELKSPEYLNLPSLSLQDIASIDGLIMNVRLHSIRQLLEAHASRLNINLSIIAEANSSQAIIELVRSNLGVTILPYAGVKKFLHKNQVSASSINSPELNVKLYSNTLRVSRNPYITEIVNDLLLLIINERLI